ncbi:MAG: hypothetical protein HQL22_09460 [Candidatus Omnitrophica bacterium]|nr:hypothetical protein [Candidatus Omnitrophota bacterium]
MDQHRKTIGLYYSHYECYGHTSRVAAFTGMYKKKFPYGNFFFIQAGRPQPTAVLDHWGAVYTLSRPSSSRVNFKYQVVADPFSADIRSRECLRIIDREAPDTFITEYFPLGRGECRDELLPVLTALFRQKVSLLSIAGYPLLTGFKGRWRDLILKMYQRVLILCPEIEMDYIAGCYPAGSARRSYREFFKKNKDKVVFTGYLVPEAPVIVPGRGRAGFATRGRVRVAVMRGGGAYYPQIIATAIKASDLLGDGYEFVLVTGPSTSDSEWRMFQGLMNRKKLCNASLVRWTDRYDHLIAESDVCICPTPYHTSLSLMKHLKRAVLIPFEGYGGVMDFLEQPARARLLTDHLRSEILPFKKLTASSLAGAVVRAVRKDMSGINVPASWFGSVTDYLS